MSVDEPPVTRWLQQAADGDRDAQEQIAEWAYAELSALAAARMRRSSEPLTLEPAGLVNETFVRLLEHPIGFANRRHFFAFMSQVMLRVLIDYQRARSTEKRGGQTIKVVLDGVALPGRPSAFDAIVVRDVLAKLEQEDPRKAEVARLRALWGLEVDEVAELLGVSKPTVIRDGRFRRNWLADRLGPS